MSLYISFTLWAPSPSLSQTYTPIGILCVRCIATVQRRQGRRSKSFRPSKVYRSSNGTRGHSGRDIRPLPAVAIAQFGQPWMTNSAITLWPARNLPHTLPEPLASIKRDSYRRTRSRKFIIIITPHHHHHRKAAFSYIYIYFSSTPTFL